MQRSLFWFWLLLMAAVGGCKEREVTPSPAAIARADSQAEADTTGNSKHTTIKEHDMTSGPPSDSKFDGNSDSYNPLTPAEAYVILRKGTEPPSEGGYTSFKDPGTYLCRRCNAPLYRADDKFESHCGWPSFDDEIDGSVTRQRDADGRRVEIVCSNCGGHLGHVFEGERMTEKNTRHCVNSISMRFIPKGDAVPETIVPANTAPKTPGT